MANNKINEDLERFKSLMGYDPSKGNTITEAKMRKEAPGYRDYMSLNEAEPGEDEETPEGGGDFDFGDEGNPEDVADTEMGGEEMGGEETPMEEPAETDEFGTADEFSAADELEDEGGDVEEIDVTSIVNKSDEAKEMAQQAVSVGQENTSYLKALTDKLSNLETQLTKMDSIASKITKLEQDIKTPEEKLELRSLDSYPFNMKLSDYWEEKASANPHYKVSNGEEEQEYTITPEDLEDFNPVEIKKTFVPESTSKKKVLTEGKEEQDIAISKIESILRNLSKEDKEEVKKSMSRKEITRDEVVKNFKRK
jgi:hypothetical protein